MFLSPTWAEAPPNWTEESSSTENRIMASERMDRRGRIVRVDVMVDAFLEEVEQRMGDGVGYVNHVSHRKSQLRSGT